MGVERCSRDGCLSGLVEEAGVWLDAREFFAFKIEDFDRVGARSAVLMIQLARRFHEYPS